jgi:glutamate-1-semialdehyde 2,1-aminomutase
MPLSFPTLGLYSTAFIASALLTRRIVTRLQLSRAKHRSLTGHARMSRQLAKWLPFYEYDEAHFFAVDGAPPHIVERRRSAFYELGKQLADKHTKSIAWSKQTAPYVSDMQFVSRYRVPYQFSRLVREHLPLGSALASSQGVTVTDLDGNTFYDLTGSYGVNVFGYDFYKGCIETAVAEAGALGPVLGGYHDSLQYNVKRLCELSGMEEVSFHMSGTEAVMQAVRLARYHTKRRYLVRFCGAYHGWWGDVQPGVGNPQMARDTYTLKDMHAASLKVLRTRKDIACVLINPLQALHPNQNAPGDSSLLDSSRNANFDRAAYTEWLQQVRQVCSERGIVLIFDEVFMGFRLGLRGAQDYFGIQADMVTYGKTVAGGLPIGVVCGPQRLMQRFDEKHPANICFARGTFNSHPYVMTAMRAFLKALVDEPFVQQIYATLDVWDRRANELNTRLRDAQLPIQVRNMSSVWTVTFTQPSRYNWMLQYYLRREGLALSWIGSGRFIFSLNYTQEDFAAVSTRFISAAQQMQADGWWWQKAGMTNKSIKRQLLKEMLAAKFQRRAQ